MNPALPQGVLVSDDVFRLIGALREAGNLDRTVGILIFLGIVAAVYLAFLSLALQVWISGFFSMGGPEKSSE
jgi:hypothetical protein